MTDDDRRPVVVELVALAPGPQGRENGVEVAPLFGQPVLQTGPQAGLVVRRPGQDPVFDEEIQSFGQKGARDPEPLLKSPKRRTLS